MKSSKSSSTTEASQSSNNNYNSGSNTATANATRLRKCRALTNNDFCSYCDEGGNLLSCDRCPASFHFLCSEPPLDLVPKGDFLCNKCITISSIVDKLPADTSIDATIVSNDTKTIKFEIEENESALETLIRIAKSLNPRQMELSDDLNLECAFDLPGLNKIKWWTKDGNKIVNVSKTSTNYSQSNPNSHLYDMSSLAASNRIDAANSKVKSSLNDENENSNSSRGAKSSGITSDISNTNGSNGDCLGNQTELCFICNKTSRDKIYQLIKCDFCPLRFHMDCLNLPLCSMPSRERLWMCPNHLENFLEQNMIKSSRLSERINLWKEYSNSNLNLNSVKLDFIKKCNQQTSNLNGHSAQVVVPQNVERCHIPEQIKNIYSRKNEATLDPVSTSVDDCSQASDEINSKTNSFVHGQTTRSFSNANEKESYLSAVEALTLLCNSNKENTNDSVQNEMKNAFLVNPPPLHKHNSNAIKPRALLVPIAATCTINETKKVEIISSLMNPRHDTVNSINSDFQQPYHMPYRYLTIGSASNMNVCLNKSTRCVRISDKHAAIFYDEQSRQYELLNYSEFGTTVDECKYGFSYSDSSSESDDENSDSKTMSSKNLDFYFESECKCRSVEPSIGMKNYWEGPALLNHGSHLKIGCLSFLFVIVDTNYDFISVENLNNTFLLSSHPNKNGTTNSNSNKSLLNFKKQDIFSLTIPNNNNNNKKLKRLKPKTANGLKRHNLIKNYNENNIEGFIKLMNNKQKKKLLMK